VVAAIQAYQGALVERKRAGDEREVAQSQSNLADARRWLAAKYR
jgi:hypothetical protein